MPCMTGLLKPHGAATLALGTVITVMCAWLRRGEYQAEVALLSRRILFTSDAQSASTTLGGSHLTIHGEFHQYDFLKYLHKMFATWVDGM